MGNLKDFLVLVFYFFYVVLLPGWLLARVVVTPGQLRKLVGNLPLVEKNLLYRYFYYLFAPAVGLILVDGVVLLMAKFHWALSFNNFFVAFSGLNILLLASNLWLVRSSKIKAKESNLSNSLIIIFIGLFLVSLLIRTVFYLPQSVPGSTDLGHHMYWTELVVQTEKFPVYDTPEVIEGEHMIFAVLAKLSGVTPLSAMPLIVLSFYNLMMLLALFFCALAVTSSRKIALWVLFFSGVYFAVDPPQAKYVEGGVIGNTFGNLFIPLVFLLFFLFIRYFYRRLNKKELDSRSYIPATALISLALIVITGSFYTHHLSTFLLGIALIFSVPVWIALTLVLNRRARLKLTESGKIILNLLRGIIFRFKFIVTLLLAAAFPLFIYLPYYLRSKAINTVTDDPEKETHLGISLLDYLGKMGLTRFLLVAACLVLALIFMALRYPKIQNKLKFLKIPANIFSSGTVFLLLGWFLSLALLSFAPGLMKVDLPSRRVVNYLVFPGIILAATAANWIFGLILKYKNRKYFKLGLAILVLAVLWDGTSDFRGVFNWQNKFQDSVELYSASEYLANFTRSDAVMLKDHRTIAGDSWIKFFLLRGYDYFLSRTYDYKYADASNGLDSCTREIITVPSSDVSQACYGQTGINYVIVKPAGDEFLFWKGKNFQIIYQNDDLIVFKRTK